MEEISLPVIVGSTSAVHQLNEIEKEFSFSDPNLHGDFVEHAVERTSANVELKMEEDVKSEDTGEVSLDGVADSTAAGPNLNEIKTELYSEPNSDGEQEGTSLQLVGVQIKSEASDMKFDISSGDGTKLEQLESEELHIKDEIDPISTDETKEKSTEDQHFDSDLCNSKFTCKRKLQQNLNNHTKAKPCKVNRGSVGKGSLREHFKSHTGEKPFKCNLCDYECETRYNLQKHAITHTEEPFKCTVCNYRCIQKCSLELHIKTHTGEKPFKCNVCDYECVQNGNLQRHVKIHTGEKPFKCSLCSYRCLRIDDLQRHVKIHTGEKPFKCSVCHYKSIRKNHLQAHMKTHTGEKPFKCNVCDYECVQQSYLQRHMKTHTGETISLQ